MIKLFRIDERLIHGQIAIKWSRHTGVDSIVVANDHAAENVMIQKSLKMAAPPGIKTVIKTLDAAIATLNDPRCERAENGPGRQRYSLCQYWELRQGGPEKARQGAEPL